MAHRLAFVRSSRIVSLPRPTLVAALTLALTLLASGAGAQERAAPRCERSRALARSQAFLFFSPTIVVEGVHLPQVGDDTGSGIYQGSGYQLRAALAFSPLDTVRGALTLDAAEAECRSAEAADHARRVLELGTTLGELPARQAELTALRAELPRAATILERAARRREEGLLTTTRLLALEREVDRLRHRESELLSAIDDLRAAGHGEVDLATLDGDVDAYEHAAMDLERDRSTLRRLAAWTVGVRGGVVPGDRVDWFGQVQIGFNLGGIAQQVAEDELLSARQEELARSRDELREHVARLRDRLRTTLPGLQREVEHVDAQLEVLERQDALLARLETGEAEELRDQLALQAMTLRAQRAYLGRLYRERAALARAPADRRPASGADEGGGDER